MTKSKKIGLLLSFILVMLLAFVIAASATTFVISNLDDVSGEGTFANGSYGLVNYGDVSNGDFAFASLVGDYNYTFVIFDIEAFKTRYNGYTAYQLEQEIFLEMQLSQNSGLQTMYYSFFYDYSYYGFESSEDMLNYAMSWQPSVSQEQFDRLVQEYSTLEQTYKQLVIANNTLQGEYNTLQDYNNTLQSNYNELIIDFEALFNKNNTLQSEYNTLQGEYNTLQGEYNTLQGEYNTLQGEYTTLNDSIPRIRAESKQVGYNEGMRDADAVERGVMSIVGSPMYILTSVFDVEIFGINLLGLITTIMTIIIVAWVIKKLAN